MKFRYDISFLRAFSVLVVLFFHYHIPFFQGGFVGVDVFFVISGFLMTQIILKGIKIDQFSFKQFYIRRATRIVPALSAMLVFVLLMSAIFFLREDIRMNAKYTFFSEFFISNIYYWRYIDYFTPNKNILIHTWTLGVEWQFYFLYPLIIFLFRGYYKRKPSVFWSILTAITFLSFCAMIYTTHRDNNFAFYMLPARFWEFSIGGLAIALGQKIVLKPLTKKILVGIGVSTLVLCAGFISPKAIWPNYITLIPVLGTVLILAVNLQTPIFRFPPFKFLGDISYSLYLWHLPIFGLFKYFYPIYAAPVIMPIMVSLIFSCLSFYLIEKKRSISNLKPIAIAFILIASVSPLLFYKSDALSLISIYKSSKYAIANYTAKWIENGMQQQFNPYHCFITNNQTSKDYDFQRCLHIDSTKKNILLIGDSHMAQFSSSFRRYNNKYNFLEASIGFTFPFLNTRGRKGTKPVMDYIMKDFIPKKYNHIDLVIISNHWLMGQYAIMHYSTEETLQGIEETVEYLEKYHIKYLFIGQSETYGYNYPIIFVLGLLGKDAEQYTSTEAHTFNDRLKTTISPHNYIDIYMSDQINHVDSLNLIPYMFDGHHLSEYGANQVVNNLVMPRVVKMVEGNN